MNIVLWILQILLAFWNLTGAIYTINHYKAIRAARAKSLPKSFWIVIGVLQILFALGLVVPETMIGLPLLTFISAVYLAVNALSGIALSAKYSGFPGMLWGVIPAIMCAVVAYGRMG